MWRVLGVGAPQVHLYHPASFTTNIVRFAHVELTDLLLVAQVKASQGGHPSWIAGTQARLTKEFSSHPLPLSPKRVGDIRCRIFLMNQGSLPATADVGFA